MGRVKGFFPSKIYSFGNSQEEWEIEERARLEKELDKNTYPIKVMAGITKIVGKKAYIDHLIQEMRKERLKEELDKEKENEDN